MLREYPGLLVLASVAGRRVGVLGYRLDGGRAEILHIAVDPGWRGRGVGRALLAWLAERTREMTAETDVEAVGFYRACGFAATPAEARCGAERFRVRWRR